MKKKIRFLLYVIFLFSTFLLALGFRSTESVWAGSKRQTVPSLTLDLTEASSQLTVYPTVTPTTEASGGVISRTQVGMVVVIVAGVLLLIGGGTVAFFYATGAFSQSDQDE